MSIRERDEDCIPREWTVDTQDNKVCKEEGSLVLSAFGGTGALIPASLSRSNGLSSVLHGILTWSPLPLTANRSVSQTVRTYSSSRTNTKHSPIMHLTVVIPVDVVSSTTFMPLSVSPSHPASACRPHPVSNRRFMVFAGPSWYPVPIPTAPGHFIWPLYHSFQ